MHCEDQLQKRGLLPGTSYTWTIQGDNPLKEGLNILFSSRRQHQAESISAAW